jgi:hypothetical protein
MKGRYSYLVRFECRDGSPDEERYFDDQGDAEDYFGSFNDPSDAELRKSYYCISLEKVDWVYRANYNIDGIVFGEE